jgi:hypothetical protein
MQTKAPWFGANLEAKIFLLICNRFALQRFGFSAFICTQNVIRKRLVKLNLKFTYKLIIFARTTILTNGYQANFKIKRRYH